MLLYQYVECNASTLLPSGAFQGIIGSGRGLTNVDWPRTWSSRRPGKAFPHIFARSAVGYLH